MIREYFVSGTAICHHLPPSGLSGETARTPQHVPSQIYPLRTFSAFWLTVGKPAPLKMADTRGSASLWREAARGCYARNDALTPVGVNSLSLCVEGRTFG